MASATFQLKAVDQTASAFASVQNSLARLQNTTEKAGKGLFKSLDLKHAMSSVAMAIGLSSDVIAQKIGRLISGTSEEQEKLGETALDLQKRLADARQKNAEESMNDAQAMIYFQNQVANLQSRIAKGTKAGLGTEEYNRSLEDQIILEETIAKIRGLKKKNDADELRNTEEYGKNLSARLSAESELGEVLGKQIDKEKLLNNLWDQRELFLTQIRDLEKDRIHNTGQLKIAERNLLDVTQKIIPLEKERRQISMDAGNILAQGFEDAVIGGRELREVLRGLAQDLLRLVFQREVTKPLAASIGNFLEGFRAFGGPVSSGAPYLVGEKGPEIFVPGASGTIIPNNKISGGGESYGGGGVNVTYNIASGVSRAELVPILENERKRLKAEIPDMVRRGGAYRAAFA